MENHSRSAVELNRPQVPEDDELDLLQYQLGTAGGLAPIRDPIEMCADANSAITALRVELDHCRDSASKAEDLEKRAMRAEAERDAARKEIEALRTDISTPIAWLRADGEGGSISTFSACITDKVKQLWLKANPVQVERYTIPLYAAIDAARGK